MNASSSGKPGASLLTMDAVVPLPGGASGSSDVSLSPANAAPNVLGIGVADSVRTSTSTQAALNRSFCLTPNLCSSSTTASPKLRHGCRGDSSACVPTQTSQAPDATAARTRLASCLGFGWPSSTVSPGLGATNSSTETLSGPNLRRKTFRCCLAKTVVGARTCVYVLLVIVSPRATVCMSLSDGVATVRPARRHRADAASMASRADGQAQEPPRRRGVEQRTPLKNRHLPPAPHRQQRGPNGHLRLPKTHVPEDQAIHWG